VGSALAFFCFNAGVIALLRPITVGGVTRQFYLPITLVTVLFIGGCLAARTVPRWAGVCLLLLYGGFVAGPLLV
jgi:cation:H+ antiporter